MNDPRLDRLYERLPAVYRTRDAGREQPLRALLRVIGEQVNVVEDDIALLYENWFIETCNDWVVPYIAELIGYRPVNEGGEPGSPAAARNPFLSPRREVAHTIRYRRRRGTLSVLELLARDVSGWPARAVEFYRLLAFAQHVNHLYPARGRTVDFSDADALDRVNGPFDTLAHIADVRRYNVPSLGLYVWPLGVYSVTHAPAYHVERHAKKGLRNRLTASLLGNDMPLYTLPVQEPEPSHIADETNVPAPIRRRAFEERTADYYGAGKSLQIWVGSPDEPVALDRIVAADLSNWIYTPRHDEVAVDPQLGRIALADTHHPREVWVTYHYAFSDDTGGGEYERTVRPAAGRTLYTVSHDAYRTISAALDRWKKDHHPPDAIIEIADSGAYTESLEIDIPAGCRLELRAGVGARPALRLLDAHAGKGDAMLISGPETEQSKRDPRLILDGLLITGRGVQIAGRFSQVIIRHCTLVPGWALDQQCNPRHEEAPSLELIDTNARVTIERSILGSIFIDQDEVWTEPLRVSISDSIVDATRVDYEAFGVTGGGRTVAHAVLTMARCTVIGQTSTHAIELAENCIFYGRVKVARSQIGCMRFCYYMPRDSRTPRRYHCQPDGVTAVLTDDDAKRRAESRVRPRFESTRYGTPSYCRLSPRTAPEIVRGADDEASMGAFHDRFDPQREANARIRLDEFIPAGIHGAVIRAN
ncbi:MAG: hypothetical protein AABO58_19540 [Acidobacteriota bacterium]